MGLKFRVNLTGFFLAACITLAISGLAVWAIDRLSFSLNHLLLAKELDEHREKIVEARDVLAENGLNEVREYVARAKSDLLETFAHRSVRMFGRLVIVDGRGQMIMHDAATDGQRLNLPCLAEMVAAGEGELMCQVDGEKRVGRYAFFPEWNWLVLVSVSAEEMHGTRNQFLELAGGAFILVSLLGWWLFIRMARGVVNPVLALSRAASDISRGRWDALPEALTRGDEIGELSRNFTLMATRLREAQIDLTAQAESLGRTNACLEEEIEERIRAEKDLRKVTAAFAGILDSMPSLVIGVDVDCVVTHWNRTARELTGKNPESVVGRPLQMAMPRLADLVDMVRRSMAEKTPLRLGRTSRPAHGELRQEEILIFPLEGEGTYGAVIRLDDVTERVRLEQMMIQSEKMTSLGGLAAGMAHEINSPLAGIGGNAQNIRNRIFGELEKNTMAARECGVSLEGVRAYATKREIPNMVDNIIASGERAAKIVRNMLKFSRNAESAMIPHDMARLLDSTLELVASDYEVKKTLDFKAIHIELEYQADMPPVPCAGGEMQQVFFNLFKNGVQAMATKSYSGDGPVLTVRLGEKDGMAQIEIEDNGPGMAEEVRGRVFEPFFTTKPVGQGTGLGLSVSYFIVTRQHGGTMEVVSAPHRGARFIIRLPLVQEPSLSREQEETPGPEDEPRSDAL